MTGLRRMKCVRDAVCDGFYEISARVYWDVHIDPERFEFALKLSTVADDDGSKGIQAECTECGHVMPRVYSAQAIGAIHIKEQQMKEAGL